MSHALAEMRESRVDALRRPSLDDRSRLLYRPRLVTPDR